MITCACLDQPPPPTGSVRGHAPRVRYHATRRVYEMERVTYSKQFCTFPKNIVPHPLSFTKSFTRTEALATSSPYARTRTPSTSRQPSDRNPRIRGPRVNPTNQPSPPGAAKDGSGCLNIQIIRIRIRLKYKYEYQYSYSILIWMSFGCIRIRS